LPEEVGDGHAVRTGGAIHERARRACRDQRPGAIGFLPVLPFVMRHIFEDAARGFVVWKKSLALGFFTV
jgi:hypothetical protein